MTYRFRPHRPFNRETSRIALAELDRALEILSNETECINRRVHDARRCFKRLRALCRLVEPADRNFFKEARAEFTTIARSLAAMRDAQAHVECCQKIAPWILSDDVAAAFKDLEQALVTRRDSAVRTDLPREIGTIVKTCLGQKAAFEKWNMPSRAKSASWILKKAWRKTIARAVSAQRSCAAGTDENAFHDLRKASQTHLLQTTLLQDVWPSMFAMHMERVRALAALLGEEHDIFILLKLLHATPDLVENAALIETALGKRQSSLRASALDKAAILFDLDAGLEAQRIASLWNLATMNRDCPKGA